MLLIILKSDFRKFDANTNVQHEWETFLSASNCFSLLSWARTSWRVRVLIAVDCNAPLKAATPTLTPTATATALPTAALTIVAQLHRRPMGTQLFDGFAASCRWRQSWKRRWRRRRRHPRLKLASRLSWGCCPRVRLRPQSRHAHELLLFVCLSSCSSSAALPPLTLLFSFLSGSLFPWLFLAENQCWRKYVYVESFYRQFGLISFATEFNWIFSLT